MPSQNVICKTCGNNFSGLYCNACGQKVIKRFTGAYLLDGLKQEVFEVDTGLWHTYRDMWTRPGEMVRDYTNGATQKYYSPLKYMIFWTALYLIALELILPKNASNLFSQETLANFVFNSNRPYSKEAVSDFTSFWYRLASQNTNYYFFGLIPFISLTGLLVYKKSNVNLTEHIILNTYFCGHFASVTIPIALLSTHTESFSELSQSIFSTLLLFVPYFYLFFNMQKGFFREKWSSTILSGLLCIVGGTGIFILLLFVTFNTLKGF